jgi:hypothetical protein
VSHHWESGEIRKRVLQKLECETPSSPIATSSPSMMASLHAFERFRNFDAAVANDLAVLGCKAWLPPSIFYLSSNIQHLSGIRERGEIGCKRLGNGEIRAHRSQPSFPPALLHQQDGLKAVPPFWAKTRCAVVPPCRGMNAEILNPKAPTKRR